MSKKESSLNWYFLIVGILVLCFTIPKTNSKRNVGLRMITIKLSNDIHKIKGSRNSSDYTFWASEYPNHFEILKGSISSGQYAAISELAKNDQIQIWITDDDFDKLGYENTKITVNAIRFKGVELLSKEAFFNNRKMYNLRIRVLTIFSGLMLIINGLNLISSKYNYLLVAVFLSLFLLFKVFRFGLY